MQVRMRIFALGIFVLGAFGTAEVHAYTSRSTKAIQLYEQAIIHHARQEYREATQYFKQALKKDKRFVEPYLQLAKIQQQIDDFAEAINLLRQAQHYLPKDKYYSLHHEIALLYYRSGAYQKAQEVLTQLPDPSVLPAALQLQVEYLKRDVAFSLEQIKMPVVFKPRLLPAPLNQFSSQYFPVLTVDQKTLFFTARSSQTHGKENIYISHKDGTDNWSPPQPLTGKINTEYNEGTCTIAADGKMLVFTACSRPGNHGICDLYAIYKKGDQWTTPRNLGPHINSKGWESQPSLSADGKTLYFVSDREGNYGKKDIWKSTLQNDGEWSKPVNLGPPINSKGREISPFIHPNGQTLFFASDRCPSLGGLDIYYSNWVNDQWTTPANLGYPINKHKDQASLFITADGQKGYYADGNQKGTDYYSSHLYEFDFPKDLIQCPKSDFIKLQVANAKTGQAMGVQVAVYDLEAGTEQACLPVTQEDGELMVVVNEGKEYGIFLNKEGYLFESIYIDYKNHDKPIISAPEKVLLKPIEVDQTQVLKNIFFDFDQYMLEPRSSTELNRLVEFLQEHPALRIEIEGHTDQIGTADYNYELSTKGAQAIYDYLIASGIDAQKLTYQGYGKSRPIASQDSSSSRQLNRRVAFKIIGLH
ncbi:MAG TPA: hypothetical protein DCQ08_02765 [Amoebophilaceae bacterium]|nr:hypothetical protein [Amoebophilaceae bacterium]